MKKVHARVYSKDGNRFLIPGQWYCEDDPKIGAGSASNVICSGLLWSTTCNLVPEEWIEFVMNADGTGTIKHYVYRMYSPAFAHGCIDLLLISGPLFDKQHMEAVQAKRVDP